MSHSLSLDHPKHCTPSIYKPSLTTEFSFKLRLRLANRFSNPYQPDPPISSSSPNMSSSRTRRIAKEIADIHADTHSQVTAEAVGTGDDLTHLKGSFKGPPGTPYEGGLYKIDVRIPSDYPFKPPIMKFETKVWHPNVSSQTVSLPECIVIYSCRS